MAADSIDRPVITGSIEGADIGNLLTQAMVLSEIENLTELPEAERNSVAVETYVPHYTQAWKEACRKMISNKLVLQKVMV